MKKIKFVLRFLHTVIFVKVKMGALFCPQNDKFLLKKQCKDDRELL